MLHFEQSDPDEPALGMTVPGVSGSGVGVAAPDAAGLGVADICTVSFRAVCPGLCDNKIKMGKGE